MKKILTLSILMLSLSSATFAFWGKPSPEERAEKMFDRMNDSLSLSEEQQPQVKALIDEFVIDMGSARDQKDEVTPLKDVSDQFKGDSFDAQVMVNAMNEMHAKRQERMIKMSESLAKLHEILTPEQRTKFADFMSERMGKRGKNRRGGWMH